MLEEGLADLQKCQMKVSGLAEILLGVVKCLSRKLLRPEQHNIVG
jgi:hypothetical protein